MLCLFLLATRPKLLVSNDAGTIIHLFLVDAAQVGPFKNKVLILTAASVACCCLRPRGFSSSEGDSVAKGVLSPLAQEGALTVRFCCANLGHLRRAARD